MEPWQYYLDELQRRTARIPPRAFGHAELFAEAAHDAYQATTDHLTRTGWNEEEALTVTRLFGQAVKDWLAQGSANWDGLRTDLDRRYTQWTGRDQGGV
jgi:hypothetical protein